MAQIMNINNAPVVNADGAYLLALKDGRISRIDGKVLSQDTEVKTYVSQQVEEVTKKYDEIISKLENEIRELKSVINGMFTAVQEGAAIIEPADTEEAPKTKSKKSKK